MQKVWWVCDACTTLAKRAECAFGVVGVFADEDLKKGARWPVLSSNIVLGARETLQSAAFHCSETVHVVPNRPCEKSDVEGKGVLWNPGAAVRLVRGTESLMVQGQINAKMTIVAVPVVVSHAGTASEHAAAIPFIELTGPVKKGGEIVCQINDDLWSKPVPKPAVKVKRQAIAVAPAGQDPLA